MRENLDGVTVFVAAAEAGSFAKAAEELALSRSAVGKAVARLEARLGVRLFHRTTRSQSLTEDGTIYYERCLRALAELKVGAAMLESGRKEVAGKLKISMPVLFGRYCVEPVLLDIATENPRLELDLRFSDQVVDIINEGYDLVIRNHRPAAGAGLEDKHVVNQRKILCAAPTYVERHGSPVAIADLKQHEALVYWQKGQIYPWSLQASDGQWCYADLKWRLQFDSYDAIADAAVKGMGIANLPAWLVSERLEAGELVALMPEVTTERFETYLIWPATQFYPLKLTTVIERLSERLRWIGEL